VLECALKAGSDVIVSGNADLLHLATFQGIEILRITDNGEHARWFKARCRKREPANDWM